MGFTSETAREAGRKSIRGKKAIAKYITKYIDHKNAHHNFF